MRCVKPLTGSLVVALMLIGPACGDNGDDETAPPQATNGNVKPSAQDLRRFLMREDEEPGFRPVGQVDTLIGVEAFVNDLGLTQADARRLRSYGHLSFIVQPIRGPQTDGLTNVELFATAEGAQRSLAHELRPDVIRSFGPVSNLRFFDAQGIPGARGWTGSVPDHPDVANVLWVQGRCMLVLGNQGPGPFAGPLSTGARAIYERTNGQCP